jgi:hypothetical protein
MSSPHFGHAEIAPACRRAAYPRTQGINAASDEFMSIRLLAIAVTGAVLGLATGYAMYALVGTSLKHGFVDWAIEPSVGKTIDAVIWAFFGTGLALALNYIFGLRTPDNSDDN